MNFFLYDIRKNKNKIILELVKCFISLCAYLNFPYSFHINYLIKNTTNYCHMSFNFIFL